MEVKTRANEPNQPVLGYWINKMNTGEMEEGITTCNIKKRRLLDLTVCKKITQYLQQTSEQKKKKIK